MNALYLVLALCMGDGCETREFFLAESWDGVDRKSCNTEKARYASELIAEGFKPEAFKLKCGTQAQIDRGGI